MNLCSPRGFSSWFLVCIDHGQAMAVNHWHRLCCLCRAIFHFHLPQFPRKPASSCTWLLGMLPPFVGCPSGAGTVPRQGGSSLKGFISMVTAGKPPPSTPPFPGTLSARDIPEDNTSCGGGYLWKHPGDAVGSRMDKAGNFPLWLSAVASCGAQRTSMGDKLGRNRKAVPPYVFGMESKGKYQL